MSALRLNRVCKVRESGGDVKMMLVKMGNMTKTAMALWSTGKG